MSSLVGAGGALIVMVVSAFLVGRCSVSRSPDAAKTGLARVQEVARSAAPAPLKPCWVTRQPVKWAPSVSNSIPFELTAAPSGSILMGYAAGAAEGEVEKNALGIEFSPAKGDFKEAFNKTVDAKIERVTPLGSDESTFVVLTTEADRTLVQLPGTPPRVLVMAKDSISIAERPDATPTTLWPLGPGDKPPEAARVQPLPGTGYALAYRRAESIFGGLISADGKPLGKSVVLVKGSGTGKVGKPMLGYSGKDIAIVFADQPNEKAAWQIRVGSAPVPSFPTTTKVITLPKGGPGGDAYAPAIAGLPDGRWLLIWTEGPKGSKAVRAQTFKPNFTPLGDPIALSPPHGNFGQGVLGVAGGYVAAVFLSMVETGDYELWGATLQCG
jgi:hypothetical protein